jgi:hypothetical protein
VEHVLLALEAETDVAAEDTDEPWAHADVSGEEDQPKEVHELIHVEEHVEEECLEAVDVSDSRGACNRETHN